MEPNSVNFDEIHLTDDELAEVKNKIRKGWEVWLDGNINYKKVEIYLKGKSKIDELNSLVNKLDKILREQIRLINIDVRFYEKSWIERDILKQLFYYLSEEDFSNPELRKPANPLVDKVKQTEILDRIIGWLYWSIDYDDLDGSNQYKNNQEIIDLLYNPTYKSNFNFPPDYPYKTNQLTTPILAELGKKLREIVGVGSL